MLIDAPLSSTGEQQARRAGNAFAEEQFLSNHAVELIVVSPLQRALQVCD
jgi:broad specificity phosphatase PhoE